jgi:hypothetical protein
MGSAKGDASGRLALRACARHRAAFAAAAALLLLLIVVLVWVLERHV